MGELSPIHWALVLAVVLLLVGSKKLPDMARGLGQSMRILRAESRAMRSDGNGDGDAAGDGQGDGEGAATPAPERDDERRPAA